MFPGEVGVLVEALRSSYCKSRKQTSSINCINKNHAKPMLSNQLRELFLSHFTGGRSIDGPNGLYINLEILMPY